VFTAPPLTLPMVAAVAVGVAVLVFLVLRRFDMQREAKADVAADDFHAGVVESVNRALAHPEPHEPSPIELVREGRGVPKPVTSAELREVVDTVKGTAGPLSATPTAAGTPPATEPAAAIAAAVKTLEGLRPPK
jgi:hypothetical protein